MQKISSAASNADEMSLVVRAAWLHYGAGLTQADVAKRLGVSSLKAHRLIAKANRDGIVRVSIDGDIEACVQLEEDLCRLFDLSVCEVAPDIDPDPLPLKGLGIIGARFLRLVLESGQEEIIGVGHGRTLAAAVAHMPRVAAPHTKFVSLIGGLTRRFAATPYDVIHRLAERTGAQAYVLPLPFFANSSEDREILMAQKGIAHVLELGRASTLRFIGIGTTEPDASLVSSGMLETDEFQGIKDQGGVGEVLGHFFDDDGRPVENAITARTLSMTLDDIRAERTVAVAGGTGKLAAIRAVLKARLLHGLITDEATARALVQSVSGDAATLATRRSE